MYPISNAVKALFDSEQAQVLRITGTDRNGASVNITDADVMDGSFNIDRYSCNGNMLEIGTATAAELTMRLNNYDGRFDNIVFEGTELFVELGIADWSLESPEVTYIPCGYFVPDEQPRTLSIITIHALDRMMRFDNTVPMMEPWTTENGTPITTENDDIIYFTASLSFPATVANLAAQLADGCAVPFTQDISGFPNASRLIEAMPSTQQRITFRNMLQWCAGLMGANAWIDWDGALRFSWYNNLTGYASTTDTRYSSDLYEDALVITGVKYTDSDDENTVYLAGNEGYPLDISGNELVDEGDIAAILNNIYLRIGNFAYTPFTASVVSAPYLWPMDRLTFTDKNGTGHVSSLTNVNFGLNGTTNLQAVGESKQSIKGTSPASFTAMQAQALKQVYRSTSTAAQEMVNHATEMITGGLGGYVVLGIDESTGQTEEILIMDSPNKQTAVNVWRFNQGGLGHSSNGYEGPFNDIALTADGQINANMITTGTLDANRISANSITLQQLTQGARQTIEDAASDASDALSAANNANYQEQTIYISKASGTSSVAANTTWCTNTAGSQNTWTTRRPVYNSSYPVLFVATQRQSVTQSSGTTCTCTTPVIDQTTTVIDGGHITTGSIDASLITTGTLSANIIKGGTLKLGGLNNINGAISVYDANNNLVGQWNKDGITAKSLTADDYVYVDGNANSYLYVPFQLGANDQYFELSSSGFTVSVYGNDSTPQESGRRAGTQTIKFGSLPSSSTEDLGAITIKGQTQANKKTLISAASYITDYTEPYLQRRYFNTSIGPGAIDLTIGTWSMNIGPEEIRTDGSIRAGNRIDCDGPFVAGADAYVDGNFTVYGYKSRAVVTEQYSERLLYCYETPSPMFGDIGEGVISEDGSCYVWLDAVFSQTISDTKYQVFLQPYGRGECHVSERNKNYFVVNGTAGLQFGWEIKAKQMGYDQKRLEIPYYGVGDAADKNDYAKLAKCHIDSIKKERENA